MVEWSDLRYFLEIQRAGTLAGAGRKLRVDQTTVGRRLGALERALEVRLFDRTPDGLALTPAGEGVLGLVEKIEENALALERQVRGEDARPVGKVRVATSEALASRFLLREVASLRARHPGIDIEVVTGQQMVDLARREADLAVRMRPRGVAPGQPDLVARCMGEMAFALYGAHRYFGVHGRPARATHLDGHDLIGYDEDLPPVPGVAWLREAGKRARFVLRCQSILTLTAGAAAGLGLAVLPCFIGDAEPELERIRPPAAIDWAEIWLVAHPDLLRTARVRAVMDGLADSLRRHARAFRGEG